MLIYCYLIQITKQYLPKRTDAYIFGMLFGWFFASDWCYWELLQFGLGWCLQNSSSGCEVGWQSHGGWFWSKSTAATMYDGDRTYEWVHTCLGHNWYWTLQFANLRPMLVCLARVQAKFLRDGGHRYQPFFLQDHNICYCMKITECSHWIQSWEFCVYLVPETCYPGIEGDW